LGDEDGLDGDMLVLGVFLLVAPPHTFRYGTELTISSSPIAGVLMRIFSASVEQINHPRVNSQPNQAKASVRLNTDCLER
jgi:hypothetical protein